MVRVSPPAFVLLLFALQAVAVVKAHWIPPPKPLQENVDYTQLESVAKIHSDFDDGTGNIDYSLEGIGANQYPFHVFVVDPKTGLIRVTKVLDRELIDTYNLSGVARYSDGRPAEKNVDIRFQVVDENDNAPVFGVIKPGEVDELSPAGTSVMKITATDADKPGHENSQIAYTIVDQNPPHDMFSISNEGIISVKNSALDREVQYELHQHIHRAIANCRELKFCAPSADQCQLIQPLITFSQEGVDKLVTTVSSPSPVPIYFFPFSSS